MYFVTVTYGQPTDTAAFDAHYTETHIPLANTMPGLRSYTLTAVEGIGGEAPAYRIARLGFDNRDDALAALASPEGEAAGGDIASFATGGATLSGGEEIDVR